MDEAQKMVLALIAYFANTTEHRGLEMRCSGEDLRGEIDNEIYSQNSIGRDKPRELSYTVQKPAA